MVKEFVCIVCPRGCNLKIDENMNVEGNFCPRGKTYAIAEVTNPTRIITSSIRVSNMEDTLVSVKTNKPVPKARIFEAMDIINKLSVEAPCRIGQVVVSNLFGLDIDVVITKEIL